MIVTRTPLRISFVGGGSDLPAFYREEPGAVVSAAIDRYIYITVNRKFDDAIRVAYSQTENVEQIEDVQHELVREALRHCEIAHGIEIHSIADIPSGTGLGSSSAFTVGLLAALAAYDEGSYQSPSWAAKAACVIEIEKCGKSIGKQDQYIAAFGGVQSLTFHTDGDVTRRPIACDTEALSSHLLLLYTGQRRSGDAGQVLASQEQKREQVRTLVNLTSDFAGALSQNNFEWCGGLLKLAWNVKRAFCTNTDIERWMNRGMQAGAWGGKLCGAGGGGFLAFLAPPERHVAITQATGLRAVPVRLGVAGSEVVYSGE